MAPPMMEMEIMQFVAREAELSWGEEMEDLKADLLEDRPVTCLHILFGWFFHFMSHLCGLFTKNKKE
jgi:hypothetical protein